MADDDGVVARVVFCVQFTFKTCKAAVDQWNAVGIARPIKPVKRGSVFHKSVAKLLLVGVQNMDRKVFGACEVIETLG